jgi:hypothetical protein
MPTNIVLRYHLIQVLKYTEVAPKLYSDSHRFESRQDTDNVD